jgi:hypothetical protein
MLRAIPLSLLASALLVSIGCTTKDSDGDGTDDGSTEDDGTPIADAGPDQTLPFEGAVNLDGSSSYDPDGDPLTYSWSFDHVPEGSALADAAGTPSPNNSADAARPAFIPDAVGTYVLQLTVSDGSLTSSPDFVIITIEEPESRPVADAGADQTVDVGASVTLDGSRSYDPDGLDLTYAWTVVSVPSGAALTTATLSGAETAAPSFTADTRGVYTLNLVVSNGLAESIPDAVNVTAVGEDGAPTANAGDDISGYDCTDIQLDASGSVDPDGDSLSYFWEVQSKPSGSTVDENSFSDRTAIAPTFFADISGTYEVSVAVYDGANWSVPDSTILTIGERTYNSPPIVSIKPYPTISGGTVECEESGYGYDCEECNNQSIHLGDYVNINDPDGDPYTVEWQITGGNATINDPTDVNTTIVLEDIEASEPDVCDPNEFDLLLIVTDCTGGVTQYPFVVTVECCGTMLSDTGK